METETKPQSGRRWIIPAAAVLALLAALLLFAMSRRSADDAEDGPKLTYAEGVTVVDDPGELQAAVDAMRAAEGTIVLEYQNDAFSEDGTTFACYIANAVENPKDMFINIYADAELTEELYLSGLVRPGSAFREITLEKTLPSGDTTAYVAFTQVEEDLETIAGQVFVTMDFHVG